MSKNSSMKMKKRQMRLKKKKLKNKNKIVKSGLNVSTEKKLWSVPIPEHNLPTIGNKVRLYHYTNDYNLSSILEHGLVKGDVYGGDFGGHNFNAPNLTAENEMHNPAGKDMREVHKNSYLRLEIYFDADDKNIVPYGWFDKTYTKNANRKIIEQCNREGQMNGNIDKQYLYKGYIGPKMIKKVSAWNPETKYWDRLSKDDIHKLSNPYNSAMNFDWLRIGGFDRNDWTGELKNYQNKTDDKKVFEPVYKLSDFILDSLGHDEGFLKTYRQGVSQRLNSRSDDPFSPIIHFVVNTFNVLMEQTNRQGIEWEDFNAFLYKRQLEIQEKSKEFEENLNQLEREVA